MAIELKDSTPQLPGQREVMPATPFWDGWIAGMVMTAPVAPIFAMALTLVFYVVRTTRHSVLSVARETATVPSPLEPAAAVLGHQALLMGILFGIGTWIVVGLFARPFVGIEGANRSVYRELRGRVRALELDLQALTPLPTPSRRIVLDNDVEWRVDAQEVSGVLRQSEDLARELGLSKEG
jgi:hypothetical protein